MANFTIGLDAELILEKNGRHVPASRYLPGVKAKFGCDGNYNVAEVRPTQTENPIELVKNIKTTFQRTLSSRPNLATLKWKGGAHVHEYPIGAHIHFGHEKYQDYRTKVHAMTMTAQLLDAFVLPFATLFGSTINELQRRRQYGYAGDYRVQNWGFEYRSCSSFIASPTTALFVLTLAYATVNEYLDGRLVEPSAQLVLDRYQFKQDPIATSSKNLEKRKKAVIEMQTIKENALYKEIVEVGFNLLGKGTYEGVDDMKSAWKLKFEAPTSNLMTIREAITFVSRH